MQRRIPLARSANRNPSSRRARQSETGAQNKVAGYRPTWRAFLNNHATDLVAIDFFVVPTVRHKILYVFLVFTHDRRRVLHFNATSNPTVEWPAQQIVPRGSGAEAIVGFRNSLEHRGLRHNNTYIGRRL
jgi:hypothetical protein